MFILTVHGYLININRLSFCKRSHLNRRTLRELRHKSFPSQSFLLLNNLSTQYLSTHHFPTQHLLLLRKDATTAQNYTTNKQRQKSNFFHPKNIKNKRNSLEYYSKELQSQAISLFLILFLQIFLCLKCRHTSSSSRSNRLPILLILHISSSKHSSDTRLSATRLRLNIPSFIQFKLTIEEISIWLVPNRIK